MKILFSADWHIKLRQKNIPKDWQINRYNLLFKKLYELEKECDIHIIGGDIFDNIPKPEELNMYFNFISEVKKPTFIYDGNHEATKKGYTFLEFLELVSNKMNSNVHIVHGISEVDDIDIIPYTHLKKFKPEDFHNNILCTHVRGSIPPHVTPEIDLTLFDRWDVVLAGDLHSYSNSQRNILYPGSPLSITFHREKITNGVIIFDTKTMTHEWIDLKLPQLIRKTVDNEKDIIQTKYDHTIYEITGNLTNLSRIDTSHSIIDKKIIDKTSESVLNFKELTLHEELELYFNKILNISSEEIKETLKIFNDYFKDLKVE